jgi:hypothetical protein
MNISRVLFLSAAVMFTAQTFTVEAPVGRIAQFNTLVGKCVDSIADKTYIAAVVDGLAGYCKDGRMVKTFINGHNIGVKRTLALLVTAGVAVGSYKLYTYLTTEVTDTTDEYDFNFDENDDEDNDDEVEIEVVN